jgi:quercetin dioxygenase-like cupin family protein
LVLENTFHAKGGPARHLHYDQDEWFYAVEGDFIIEVGPDRIRLQPGDSLLAPRKIPRLGARRNARGRMLIAFMPAVNGGVLPAVTKANLACPR